ncbi:hypothetical protein COP2_013216 [Malus domestica]
MLSHATGKGVGVLLGLFQPKIEGKVGMYMCGVERAACATCLEGLKERGSTSVEVVKHEMNKSKEYSSNSLAIMANFKGILDKRWKLRDLPRKLVSRAL